MDDTSPLEDTHYTGTFMLHPKNSVQSFTDQPLPSSNELSPLEQLDCPPEYLDLCCEEPDILPTSTDLQPELLELSTASFEVYPEASNHAPLDSSGILPEPIMEPDVFSMPPDATNVSPEPTSESPEATGHGNAQPQPNLEFPLYPGASLTVHTTLLLILAFVLSHNLTNQALSDLLSLLNVILLQPHHLPTSTYKFYKYLKINKAEATRHYYCSACETPLEPGAEVCPNGSCRQQVLQNTPYFLQLSLEQQIQNLFKRPHFYEQIQHRFEQTKQSDRNIEDIYDGEVYKELAQPGRVLSFPSNVSLLWNTDGIPVFKSSNYAVWPLYFVVNELPYKLRMRKQNILLGGLWFGSSKPNMHVFLRPFWKALSRLELHGTVVQAWGSVQNMVCKVVLLAGTCDLPAKCLVHNSRQYNGFMGCSKCLQPGATLTLGPRSHTHVYPYIPENPTGPLRSSEQMAEDVRYYMETGNTRNGVLGPAWFGCLKYFDLVRGTGIDYMHGCLLGVTRRLLSLWLSPQNHQEPFYVGHLCALLDRRLLSIKPTAEVSRVPRSLNDRKHWKASEYRSFLLYYSLPVLQGVLPAENFQHFALLVVSLRKLLSTSISPRDLLESEKLLNLFCKRYAQLYGAKEMTANLHGLLHLTATVKDLGPLWAYSCFFFEGLNGLLLKHVHGTQGIGLQCITTFSMIQAFPPPEQMPALSDIQDLDFLKTLVVCSQSHSPVPQTLGKAGSSELTALEVAAVQTAETEGSPLDLDQLHVRRFTRLRVNGVTFHSLSWQESQRRHDCTVKFSSDHSAPGCCFGQIESFIEVTDTSGIQCLIALVTVLQCSTAFPDLPLTTVGLSAIQRTTTLLAVPVSRLLDKCMLVHTGDSMYISELIDIFEKD